MRLVPNWWAVLTRAWSIRLLIVAGVLSGLEIALPLMEDFFPLDRGVFAALSFAATAGAFVARLVAQSKVSGGVE